MLHSIKTFKQMHLLHLVVRNQSKETLIYQLNQASRQIVNSIRIKTLSLGTIAGITFAEHPLAVQDEEITSLIIASLLAIERSPTIIRGHFLQVKPMSTDQPLMASSQPQEMSLHL